MTAFAAAPATITLKDFPSATGTSKPYYYYKSPLLGNGSSGKGQMAHEITIKAPDENKQIRERIAFCANNGKRSAEVGLTTLPARSPSVQVYFIG